MIAVRLTAFGKLAKRASALPCHLLSLTQRVKRDISAVAFVEFAYSAPIMLAMGMLGTETANFVITHMQISQVAMQVADNVSRARENDILVVRKVNESDINDALIGAEKLGERVRLFERGRVIISSLQRNADGGQWIAWQRCRGAKVHQSSYGREGDGATGTSFPGMGRPGNRITASPGTAVIFVEIAYDYESLTPFDLFDGEEINYTAAFNIRDSRDLTGINNDAPRARCDVFSAARPT
jgi:hypothetical protein